MAEAFDPRRLRLFGAQESVLFADFADASSRKRPYALSRKTNLLHGNNKKALKRTSTTNYDHACTESIPVTLHGDGHNGRAGRARQGGIVRYRRPPPSSHNQIASTIQFHFDQFFIMFKSVAALALIGSAAAFAPAQTGRASTSVSAFTIDNMPGALAPMGFFDPLNFAEKADENTLKRYREAEVTHGRVAMLAVLGFLVGEAVEG
ncbi:hypothetical protein THAOC_31987, partial [Thalassiosira oceanica]